MSMRRTIRQMQPSSRSQFFQIDQHESESRTAAGMPYDHMGRTVAPENASFFHSIPTVPANGLGIPPGRQLQFSTNFGLEGAPIFAPGSGPSSCNTLSHFPAGGSSYPLSEPNMAQPQFGLYNRHVLHEPQGGLVDMMGSGRGAFKRKYPYISESCDRGSTSRLHGAGISSNSFEFQATSDYRNSFPMGLPSIRGNSLSIAGDDSQRNVRSRTTIDMEIDARGVYSSHPYCSSSWQQNKTQSTTVTNLNIDSTKYGNHGEVSAATHRRFQTYANSSMSHGMNSCFVGGHTADLSWRNLNESMFGRNPAPHPPYLHYVRHVHDASHIHAPRENQSNNSQGTLGSYRTDLHSSHLVRQTTAPDHGPRYTPENYLCRYRRSFSAGGWRNSHRAGRSRITTRRFNPLHSVANARDRMQNEAVSVLNRPYWHASRNLFDQYRDMRLDIDNMTYEELLALGESIGHVNTGLSEDVISKCMMDNAHSSQSDQDVSSCVICLEEYENMEKVGKLKKCGHEYHVDCIRNWLATKNACPICKAPALVDASNGK